MESFGTDITQIIVGRWSVKLDDRGRFQVPSEVRVRLKSVDEQFGFEQNKLYVSKSLDKPVQLFTQTHFYRMVQRVVDEIGGEALDSFLTQIGSSSSLVSIDKGGRATVPEYVMADARMKPNDEVVLVGKVYFLELWKPDYLEDRLEELRNRDDANEVIGKVLSTLPKADWRSGRATPRSSRRAAPDEECQQGQEDNTGERDE
ncbi:MAG: hypothetical protein U5N86_01495 [Planctomycetota bacterium]|nr:hypothetical protein [Planctomycetota bacterium]